MTGCQHSNPPDEQQGLTPTLAPAAPMSPMVDKSDPGLPAKRKRVRNQNALTHAMRSALGALPAGAGYVNRLAYAMRRELEQAVASTDGSISLTKAAWIDSAVKWERHGQLATRWLRLHHDEMDLGQRLEFSREVAKATDARNKAIQALDLDRDPGDALFAQLYGPRDDALQAHQSIPTAMGDTQPASTTWNATDATSEAQGAN
jgi:hypothetical protein